MASENYPNPPVFNGQNYNSSFWSKNQQPGLTYSEAIKKFVAYPLAQGTETFSDNVILSDTAQIEFENFYTNNEILIQKIDTTDGNRYKWLTDLSGSQTMIFKLGDAFNFYKDMTINGSTISPTDNSTFIPTTAWVNQFVTSHQPVLTNYAKLNNSGVNQSFISPITFQGSNASTGAAAPLIVNNSNTSEYFSLFVDPNPNNDITLYSNQTVNAGLTIRNPSYSFTVNPVTGNVAQFQNAVSSISNITASGALIGNSLQIISTSATLNGNQIATTNQIPNLNNVALLTDTSAQTFTGVLNFGSDVQYTSAQSFPQPSTNILASLAYVNNLGGVLTNLAYTVYNSNPAFYTVSYLQPNTPFYKYTGASAVVYNAEPNIQSFTVQNTTGSGLAFGSNIDFTSLPNAPTNVNLYVIQYNNTTKAQSNIKLNYNITNANYTFNTSLNASTTYTYYFSGSFNY